MNKYLIKIPHDRNIEHHASQNIHHAQFTRLGISWKDYKWNHGTCSSAEYSQTWTVKCSEERLSMLVLQGATVIMNLSDEWRRTGLAKLSKEVIEALGLN